MFEIGSSGGEALGEQLLGGPTFMISGSVLISKMQEEKCRHRELQAIILSTPDTIREMPIEHA